MTIMEIVVAAALFSISMLVLLGIFPLSARAVRKAEVRTIAVHLAENQMERARSISFSAVGNVPAYSSSADIVNNSLTETIDFTIAQTVTDLGSGLKHTIVNVSWRRENQDQSVFLETDFASTQP